MLVLQRNWFWPVYLAVVAVNALIMCLSGAIFSWTLAFTVGLCAYFLSLMKSLITNDAFGTRNQKEQVFMRAIIAMSIADVLLLFLSVLVYIKII